MKKAEEIIIELRDAIRNISSGERAPDSEQLEEIERDYEKTLSEQIDTTGSNYIQELLYRYNCENFAFFSSLYLRKDGILRRVGSFGHKDLSKAIAPLLKNPLQSDKMHLFPLSINHNTFTLYTLLSDISPRVTVLFCAISSSSFFSLEAHERCAGEFSSLFSTNIFTITDEESLINRIAEAGASKKYACCLLCNCQSITEIFSHYGTPKILTINTFIRDKFAGIYPEAAIFEFSIGVFVLFFRESGQRTKSLINYNGVPIPVKYKEITTDRLQDEEDYYDFLTR